MGVLRFGPFEFEVANRLLRKYGKPVQLQPQPAKILALLISRSTRVITREELRQEIWGQDTFVDFEHNLNFSVRQIRAALHDDAEKPRFIETLPRRGYRFIAEVEQVLPEAARRIESLAVLPLENLSQDPEQEYFADGITDELITELAKIGALRVISRTSVQQFKRVRKPLREIARRLNVDAVVEGTILRWGNRVRITAQLIDARREEHLWAESYERDLDDVLRLQAEVAQAISGQIHSTLKAEEQSRLRPARRIDPAAHECYLRGRYFWNKRTEEDLCRAQKYFEQAIDRDPGYALAYSGLADTYFYRGYAFGHMAPKDAMPKARAAALRALELDDTLAESHVSLALVRFFFDWDWPGAEQEFKRAIELNPNYATTHHAYSALLAATGRKQEAIAEAQRALELDPLSIPINNILGEIYICAGECKQAIGQYRKTIEMDPSVWLPHENLGVALEEIGKDAEAVDEYLKAGAISGESPEILRELRAEYESSGLRGFRRKQVELERARWEGRHFDTFRIAAHYARLDEQDEAIAWLERAFEARSGEMIWIKLYPVFQKLYANPRFEDVARRVGLPADKIPA
jgi:TolB-like protein/tetratricopeptide (TPR) repeat protein